MVIKGHKKFSFMFKDHLLLIYFLSKLSQPLSFFNNSITSLFFIGNILLFTFNLYIYLYLYLSIYICTYLTIHLSNYLTINLSTYLTA